MQAAASATAYAELALIRQHLHLEIQALGWQLSDLELDLHLRRAAKPAAALLPATASSCADGGNGGALGALAAAAAELKDAEPSTPLLPLLEFRVRGAPAVVLTVELTSGQLCLCAGASEIRGYAVATVRCAPPMPPQCC